MKKSFLFSALVLLFLGANAQVSNENKTALPRLTKLKVGESSMYAYLPSGSTFEKTQSEDGSDVYTSETTLDNGFNIGLIGVEFAAPFTDASKEELSDLLVSYLNYLQQAFEITAAAGYGKGHVLESVPDAQGIIDYWEDKEKTQYAIKGWITPKHICVFFVYGATEFPVYNYQSMLFEGFREE